MKLMGNRKLFVSEQLLARDLDSGCQQSVNKTVDKWNRRFWWFEVPYEHAKPISYRYATLMTFGACPDQHSPQENLFKFSVNNFVNNFVDKIVDTFSISILEKNNSSPTSKIEAHWLISSQRATSMQRMLPHDRLSQNSSCVSIFAPIFKPTHLELD